MVSNIFFHSFINKKNTDRKNNMTYITVIEPWTYSQLEAENNRRKEANAHTAHQRHYTPVTCLFIYLKGEEACHKHQSNDRVVLDRVKIDGSNGQDQSQHEQGHIQYGYHL